MLAGPSKRAEQRNAARSRRTEQETVRARHQSAQQIKELRRRSPSRGHESPWWREVGDCRRPFLGRAAIGKERRVLRSGFVWRNEDAKWQAMPAPAATAEVSSRPLSRFRCKIRKPVRHEKSQRSCALSPRSLRGYCDGVRVCRFVPLVRS